MVPEPQDSVIRRLENRLSEEPQRIAEAKKNGAKVIGYFCPYVPEEIILAAGMIPIRLAFGGELEPATAGEEFLKSYSCPYARCCLGYKLEGKNEYFNMLDAICVAQTCENMKRVSEYYEKYLGIPVFSIGMPHTHEASRSRPQALEYFKKELELFRQRLGDFAGKPIKGSAIRNSIKLSNSIREKLRLLFEYPREPSSPIEWRDAIRITQAGFVLEHNDYLSELDNLTQELEKKPPSGVKDNRVRLMITGSVLAVGDHKILDIVNESGGNIVADAVCTGSMFARKNVTIFGIMGNPIDALAERYLYNIPCPCMTDLDKRLSRIAKIARDYNVSGIIYYNLKYCDSWRAEFPIIKNYLNDKLKVPSLLLESEYSSSDVGVIKTKAEAFIEMLRGV